MESRFILKGRSEEYRGRGYRDTGIIVDNKDHETGEVYSRSSLFAKDAASPVDVPQNFINKYVDKMSDERANWWAAKLKHNSILGDDHEAIYAFRNEVEGAYKKSLAKGNGNDEYQAQDKSSVAKSSEVKKGGSSQANVSDDGIVKIVRGNTLAKIATDYLTKQHDGQKPSAKEVQNMVNAIAELNGVHKDKIITGKSLVMPEGTQAVHTASLGGRIEKA